MELLKDILNAQFSITKAIVDYNTGFVKGVMDAYEKQVRDLNRM